MIITSSLDRGPLIVTSSPDRSSSHRLFSLSLHDRGPLIVTSSLDRGPLIVTLSPDRSSSHRLFSLSLRDHGPLIVTSSLDRGPLIVTSSLVNAVNFSLLTLWWSLDHNLVHVLERP